MLDLIRKPTSGKFFNSYIHRGHIRSYLSQNPPMVRWPGDYTYDRTLREFATADSCAHPEKGLGTIEQSF